MQNLLLNFLKLNFLPFDVALVAISVVVARSVNCWESECVFSRINAFEVIRIPLNVINPEF